MESFAAHPICRLEDPKFPPSGGKEQQAGPMRPLMRRLNWRWAAREGGQEPELWTSTVRGCAFRAVVWSVLLPLFSIVRYPKIVLSLSATQGCESNARLRVRERRRSSSACGSRLGRQIYSTIWSGINLPVWAGGQDEFSIFGLRAREILISKRQ